MDRREQIEAIVQSFTDYVRMAKNVSIDNLADNTVMLSAQAALVNVSSTILGRLLVAIYERQGDKDALKRNLQHSIKMFDKLTTTILPSLTFELIRSMSKGLLVMNVDNSADFFEQLI